MLETIISFDKWLFYAINVGCANPVTDYLMPIITNITNWVPLILVALLYAFMQDKKKALILVFSMAILIAISDQTSSNLLKEIFGRVRPCRELGEVHLLVGCGAGKSFPSSHAANSFAAATLLSFFYRRKRAVFYSMSVLIALSRVFNGVHYPVDIFAGAILGTLLALGVIYLLKMLGKKIPALRVE